MKTTALKTLVLGSGWRNLILLRLATDEPGHYGIGETTFENGPWVGGRRLNGDQTHQGRHIRRSRKGAAQTRLFRMALITMLVVSAAAGTYSQQSVTKEIAITIDDLPLNGPRVELARLRVMTDRLLSGIQRHQVPVVGFVNESLLYVPAETDARMAILKSWFDHGVELGNHTFAHVGFRDTPLADYEDDFVRGETITRSIMKSRDRRPRFFRHPFLQMGPTKEQEQSFEAFIAARGYRIAPITIDIMDWMFRVAYVNARNQNDATTMKRVVAEYLRFADTKIEFCERVAADLFGRPIKHILLLHANELNADNFDRLMKVFTDRGYRFINLDVAIQDDVYQFPDQYRPTSDWLNHWSFSKGKKFDTPQPPDFIRKIYEDSLKPAG